FQLGERLHDRIFQISGEVLFQKVGDDFGVRFSREFVAFLSQLPLQGKVVLDNPVVSNDNAPLAVPMGVRIFFGGASVGRPTRVSQSKLACNRLLRKEFFEASQLAGGPANLKSAVLNDSDSGGVVPPVFK